MADATGLSAGWEAIATAAHGGVALVEGDTVARANRAFAAAFGMDRSEDVVGATWHDLYGEDERDRLAETVLPRVRDGERWRGTATGRRRGDSVEHDLALVQLRDGRLLWSVSPVGLAPGGDGSAEGDRSREARFLREVLDAVDDVVYVIDEDGESHRWNEALVETTGYTHEELEAMHPMELIPEDQHEFVPGLMEAIDAIEDRRVDVDILAKDGERITHEFTGTTFEDPETGRSFRCGVARDVTDQRRRQRELERYETIIETVDDGVYALDGDLRFTFVNDALCELFETPREELLGTSPMDYFTYDDEAAMADEIRRRVVEGDTSRGTVLGTVETPDGERVLESNYRLHPEPDGEYRGSVGVIRDVTEREERERALTRQRDELATLDRISDLVLETVRELVQTASRETVERTICERLAASAFYRFAWIGAPALDGDRIVPRASAGEDDGYLDEVTITDDGSETGRGPAGRAMDTGEVQVANVDDDSFAPWREAAVERGLESVAAVPLHHDETVYGVLVVYATREDGFTEREQDGFDVLGRTVGFVIHAARNRDLLFADALVELEFQVGDADSVVAQVPRALDCRLSLDGYVASGDRWITYLSVTGAAPGEVVATAANDAATERARVVDGGADGGRVELVLSASSLLGTLASAGGRITAATVEPDGGRISVEAPADADLREVVEVVREAYPETDLLATRERDGDAATVGRPDGLLDDLTDRQCEVMTAAYRAGYFDWPRESTAQELADALDITPATLHGHLRKAEATILSAVLDPD